MYTQPQKKRGTPRPENPSVCTEQSPVTHHQYNTLTAYTAKQYAVEIDAATPFIEEFNEEQQDILGALEDAFDQVVRYRELIQRETRASVDEYAEYQETTVYRWIRILRAHPC